MAVIALDLGGTKLAGALFLENGELRYKDVRPLPIEKGEAVGDLINSMIEEISRRFSPPETIRSIGICVPGIYRQRSKRVWAPNIPGWEDYPLWEKLHAVSGGAEVRIDSDRACCILGEVWKGAAKGCSDVIFTAVGTGIGAGILSGGHVLRGALDIAGAIGWMALDTPYRSDFDQCGCYEQYASGEGIARTAQAMLQENPDYDGSLASVAAGKMTAYHVFAAYQDGDPMAKQVMKRVIQFWGMATANLISIFNPEKIIYGGGIFGPAADFLPQIRKEAQKWAQPISMKRVELRVSALGEDAGLYGAAYLALKDKIHTGYGKEL